MKFSEKLNKELNGQFNETDYLINQLLNGNKKRRASVKLHKQALKIIK